MNNSNNVPISVVIPTSIHIIYVQSLQSQGLHIGEFPLKYERYEIRLRDGRVYSHIVYESVDYSNDNFLKFTIDDDMNDYISHLGSPIRKVYLYDENQYTFRKNIVIDYKAIASIEFIFHKPL